MSTIDKIVRSREHLVLYTTATCNLRCVYCYIDKNPALVKIDKELDKSFKGDYYFNFAKEMFPDPQQLKWVEFWGGEPTLRLDRAYETVEKLIGYYPNLSNFFMSTNFTGSNWNDQFFGFIRMLQKYPNRRFFFNLQLSLDGPEYINDAQRGKGVTKKFEEHFISYIDMLNEVLNIPGNNVEIIAQFKPTLTSPIIHNLIQDKKNIIDYYQFFDSFKDYFENNIKVPKQFADFHLTIPNTASPSPHTKQDGKDFAQFCKYCEEINLENRTGKKYFKYFSDIMPFVPRCKVNYDSASYTQSCGACGSGRFTVGLLPFDYISCCHNGFVNLISDYKEHCEKNKDTALDFRMFMDKSNYMIQTKESYKQYEKNVAFAYTDTSGVKLGNMAAMISLLAKNHQIDEKYVTPREAQKAALFIQMSTAYCFRDNVASTGSAALFPVGILKLLLNGAKEVIENDIRTRK